MKKILVFLLLITGSAVFAHGGGGVIPVNFSYFGETIIHPGFEIGYENAFYNGFNFTVSIGFYIHQRNHTGFYFNSGINWRHTFPVGYSMEFGIGFGYLHTFVHGGDTYTVDDNGDIFVKPNYGRSNFMPLIKLGLFGWDLRNNAGIPIRINLDVIIFGQFPYNNFIMPHIALKTGTTYFFELDQN